jgi:hypothetical protein
MKRKTKSHVKVIMLLFIALLMFNCQNDENSSYELQNKIETITIDEAKNFLMHSKNNSSAKSTSNEFENLEFNKITQEKINGSDQLLTVIPYATNNDHENNRVLMLKIDNEIKSVVFSMYPDEGSLSASFSGKLFSYSLDGTFITGFRARNGIIVSQFIENNIPLKTNNENEKIPIFTRKSPVQLNEVVVKGKPGKTVDALDVFGDSMFNDFDSGSSYYSWDAGGGSGFTAPTAAEIAVAIEKQINADKLDECTKAVLEKLKNLKQGDIASMITRFAPAASIFNINMSTGQVQNNNANIWAQTNPVNGSSTDINMIFNQDYINGNDNPNRPTDLSVATTMAHEIVHAYLISQLKENKTLGASVIYDFPTIYEAYVQQEITKNPKVLPDEHHELIAKKYVNSIASTIQEFHTGQPVTSGFPHQVYLDMAWGGLDKTKIFNTTYPNDPNHKNYKDRERILGRIITEKKGDVYGIYSPIGTPCKK